jgi:hypothetical protein
MPTITEMPATCGVATKTISQRQRKGLIHGPSWPLPTIQIIDGDGGDGVCRRETEDDTIEEQLGFEASGDRVGPTESMLLALEREEGHGQTLRPNGLGHRP